MSGGYYRTTNTKKYHGQDGKEPRYFVPVPLDRVVDVLRDVPALHAQLFDLMTEVEKSVGLSRISVQLSEWYPMKTRTKNETNKETNEEINVETNEEKIEKNEKDDKKEETNANQENKYYDYHVAFSIGLDKNNVDQYYVRVNEGFFYDVDGLMHETDGFLDIKTDPESLSRAIDDIKAGVLPLHNRGYVVDATKFPYVAW
jgi:vacuolar-type H+-ATPase subunit I/STV1